MFAHPKCGCTQASLDELAAIIVQSPGQLTAYVVFVKPIGAGANWSDAELVQSAAQLPGVQVRWDDRGQLAGLFEAKTSGNVVLYDESHRLLFQGGITVSRGHVGISDGRVAILDHLAGVGAPLYHTPAFGCPLFASEGFSGCGGGICVGTK
jgi:hypothetical protein